MTATTGDVDSKRIKKNQGYTKRLGESICKVYGIPPKCIEIGFITPTTDGCSIHLQHSIFKSDLEDKQKKQNRKMGRGMRYEVTPQMYIEDLFGGKRDGVKQCIVDHFGLDDHHKNAYTVKIDEEENETVVAGDEVETRTNGGEYKDGNELEMVALHSNIGTKADHKNTAIMPLLVNMENEMRMLRQLINSETNGNNEEMERNVYLPAMESTEM